MILFHGSPKIGLNKLEIGDGPVAAQGRGVYLTNDKKAANFYARGFGSIYTVKTESTKVFLADDLSFLFTFFKIVLHIEEVKKEIELFSVGASSFLNVIRVASDYFDLRIIEDLKAQYNEYLILKVNTLMSQNVQIYVVKDPSILEIIEEEDNLKIEI